MRISKISIKNLFGTFNHEIILNNEERVTIIIGPNGYGKTTILKLINSLVLGDFNSLYSTPFEELKIDFINGSSLCIEKKSKNQKKGIGDVSFLLIYSDVSRNKQSTYDLMDFLSPRSVGLQFSSIDELRQDAVYTYRRLREREMDESPNFFEVYRRMTGASQEERDNTPAYFRYSRLLNDKEFQKKIREIDEIIGKIRVHFTTTQRLIKYPVSERNSESRPQVPVVEIYSSDLSKQIEMTLARAMQHAQDIDSSFPKRITESLKKKDTKVNFRNLLSELEDLEFRRARLRNTGLFLELGDDLGVDKELIVSDRKDLIGTVLKEYIKDTQKKLEDFDELVSKLELLKGIVNDRFINKTFEISKEKGFIIKNNQISEIPVGRLSSGEQQELVMFYEFLFKVQKDSLLLIDEPELSLHIEWQQKFLKDLLEVAKLVGFDVLIATHAPAIINQYWDLTVDLAGVG